VIILDPENEGTIILRNVGNYVPGLPFSDFFLYTLWEGSAVYTDTVRGGMNTELPESKVISRRYKGGDMVASELSISSRKSVGIACR
jgi:hypothetical protein